MGKFEDEILKTLKKLKKEMKGGGVPGITRSEKTDKEGTLRNTTEAINYVRGAFNVTKEGAASLLQLFQNAAGRQGKSVELQSSQKLIEGLSGILRDDYLSGDKRLYKLFKRAEISPESTLYKVLDYGMVQKKKRTLLQNLNKVIIVHPSVKDDVGESGYKTVEKDIQNYFIQSITTPRLMVSLLKDKKLMPGQPLNVNVIKSLTQKGIKSGAIERRLTSAKGEYTLRKIGNTGKYMLKFEKSSETPSEQAKKVKKSKY
jgi:hypothetical protein